jgi:hypothetical protein
MKYICLGYIEPGKFEGMTEDERNAVLGRGSSASLTRAKSGGLRWTPMSRPFFACYKLISAEVGFGFLVLQSSR